MADWVYFVLAAYGIWSVTSIIDKIVISRGYIKNPLVYIVLNGLMNVFLVFLLPFVGFESLSFANFLIALISGVALSTAVAVYYKAVNYEEISRIIMMFQLTPIFVLVLSFLFLGEVLTRSHFIGFFVLICAGILASYKKVQKSFKLSKAFYYIMLSNFIAAIYYVSSKHVFNATSFWSAFLWLRLASFSAVAVLLVPSVRQEFADTFRNMNNRIRALLGFKMLIDFSAFAFLGYAIFKGPISLVSALGDSILPLLVFVLALFISIYFPNIVKEEVSTRVILTKLLALALIIAGIIFVNYS